MYVKGTNMKKLFDLKSGLFGAAVAAALFLSIGAATPAEPRNKVWEYTTHFYGAQPSGEKLNQIGALGWELVAHIPPSPTDGNGGGFIFKRVK
jgi:hypothetical protein